MKKLTLFTLLLTYQSQASTTFSPYVGMMYGRSFGNAVTKDSSKYTGSNYTFKNDDSLKFKDNYPTLFTGVSFGGGSLKPFVEAVFELNNGYYKSNINVSPGRENTYILYKQMRKYTLGVGVGASYDLGGDYRISGKINVLVSRVLLKYSSKTVSPRIYYTTKDSKLLPGIQPTICLEKQLAMNVSLRAQYGYRIYQTFTSKDMVQKDPAPVSNNDYTFLRAQLRTHEVSVGMAYHF